MAFVRREAALDWEKHRWSIQHLYLTRNETLKEVMEHMLIMYKFKAT